MKERADAILRPAQAAYLERTLPPRDSLLQEMERLAAEQEVPISDPEVGYFLQAMASALDARRILEIGTAIGYGAICLARGAEQATVVTIDHDAGRLAQAAEFLERAGVRDRVELVEGEALERLADLDGPFDLVYLDARKADYRRYLDRSLPLLRKGGLVVADNLLWGGRVADPELEQDESAEALRSFNGYLLMHPQLTAVILPLGDGLGVASKRQAVMTELGGPF